MHKAAATGITLISKTVTYCEIFYSLKVMYRVDPKLLGKTQLSEAQKDLFTGYKKMQALAGVLKNVASYAPPIISDYMTFVLDFFITAEAPIKMVANYAQNLVKELKNIKKAEQKMYHEPNSKYNAYSQARKATNREKSDNWVFDKCPK